MQRKIKQERNMSRSTELKWIAVVWLPVFSVCFAHAEGPSKAELAKAARNPIANLISLPLQSNINTETGHDDYSTDRQFRIQQQFLFPK